MIPEGTWDDKQVCRRSDEQFALSKWNGYQSVFIWDIDDVISNFRSVYASWLATEKNIIVDLSCKEYFFERELVGSSAAIHALYDEFGAQRRLRNLDRLEAFDVMNKLHAEDVWIHIVTARAGTDVSASDTFRWLRTHGASYDRITFTHDKTDFAVQSDYFDAGKLVMCIDDSPTHVDSYARQGIRCAMPVTSYNHHITHDIIHAYEHAGQLHDIVKSFR